MRLAVRSAPLLPSGAPRRSVESADDRSSDQPCIRISIPATGPAARQRTRRQSRLHRVPKRIRRRGGPRCPGARRSKEHRSRRLGKAGEREPADAGQRGKCQHDRRLSRNRQGSRSPRAAKDRRGTRRRTHSAEDVFAEDPQGAGRPSGCAKSAPRVFGHWLLFVLCSKLACGNSSCRCVTRRTRRDSRPALLQAGPHCLCRSCPVLACAQAPTPCR